jgi:fatty-acyl-CoA synthase
LNLDLGKNGLSYDHGVSDEPLVGSTLGAYFDQVAAKLPHKQAIVSLPEDISLTYSELLAEIESFALGLIALGIEAGDRVGIWAPNNVQWVITQFATAKIGAILVNINPAFRLSELEYVVKHAGIKLIIMTPKIKTSDCFSMACELIENRKSAYMLKKLVLMHDIKAGSNLSAGFSKEFALPFADVQDLGKVHDRAKLEDRQAHLQFDEPINIQYTSGTTGFPKGVTLSHHNLLNNSLAAAKAMCVDSQSRFCVPTPFYHCAGMVVGTLVALFSGGTLVIPAPIFDAEATLIACARERCTHLSGVPTMFIAQLQHEKLKELDLSSLRSGFMAGAPVPIKLMQDVAAKMHLQEILILYGLTEASPLITGSKITDPVESRATNVGVALPHVEIKVVDPMTNQTVPYGEQGEICTRGYHKMLGYWEDQYATVQTIDTAGWLHTGDLGTMDKNGYIRITGRKKDMIIRGGENIYPREIEELLHTHPAIIQGQVFGVPDEQRGEEVACWVQLKAGASLSEDELKQWLKDKVAYFKIPRYIKFVNEFPLTVTGKVQKFAMRDQVIKDLDLTQAASIQTA